MSKLDENIEINLQNFDDRLLQVAYVVKAYIWIIMPSTYTAEGRHPKTTVVRDCLSSEPAYGFEDQDLEDAQTLMEQKQIRRLPVMSRDEELVGIVALGDLASKVSAAMVGQATQAISSSK